MSDTILSTSDGRFRVTVTTDDYAENPRDWSEPLTGALTVPDRQYNDVPESGPLADAWARLMDTYGPSRWTGNRGEVDRALTIMERYIRLCGGVSETFTPYDGPTALLYVTPPMMESAGFSPAEITTERMSDLLRGELQELRAWSEGDVWTVTVEERAHWQRTDDGHDSETMETWDVVESLGNVIGHQYTEETARDLLAGVLGVTMHAAEGPFLQSVDTSVVCPGCAQRITVTRDGTECGGQGEGGCNVIIGETPDHAAHESAKMAHMLAIAEAAPFLD